jgi:hypothetical protein
MHIYFNFSQKFGKKRILNSKNFKFSYLKPRLFDKMHLYSVEKHLSLRWLFAQITIRRGVDTKIILYPGHHADSGSRILKIEWHCVNIVRGSFRIPCSHQRSSQGLARIPLTICIFTRVITCLFIAASNAIREVKGGGSLILLHSTNVYRYFMARRLFLKALN